MILALLFSYVFSFDAATMEMVKEHNYLRAKPDKYWQWLFQYETKKDRKVLIDKIRSHKKRDIPKIEVVGKALVFRGKYSLHRLEIVDLSNAKFKVNGKAQRISPYLPLSKYLKEQPTKTSFWNLFFSIANALENTDSWWDAGLIAWSRRLVNHNHLPRHATWSSNGQWRYFCGLGNSHGKRSKLVGNQMLGVEEVEYDSSNPSQLIFKSESGARYTSYRSLIRAELSDVEDVEFCRYMEDYLLGLLDIYEDTLDEYDDVIEDNRICQRALTSGGALQRNAPTVCSHKSQELELPSCVYRSIQHRMQSFCSIKNLMPQYRACNITGSDILDCRQYSISGGLNPLPRTYPSADSLQRSLTITYSPEAAPRRDPSRGGR